MYSQKCMFLSLALLLLSSALAYANTPGPVVLFDSEGFMDAEAYPPGPLGDAAHGEARWRPLSGACEIVARTDDDPARVLRSRQTGSEAVDFLDFPPATGATLTVAFSARVSTASSRTLDLSLMRSDSTAGSAQASLLIWGHEPGYLSYFDGRYRQLAPIDTEWRDYEVIHNLGANTFTVRMDGETVGEDLAWRNRFDPETTFGRLRIGTIRGDADEYADIANLRVTRSPMPPVITITAPLATGGIVDPEQGLQFTLAEEKDTDIRVTLNGEDATQQLTLERSDRIYAAVGNLEPDTSYRAVIHAANAHGQTESEVSFHTFTDTVPGYRGIWFTLGQLSGPWGDKYSAGSSFAWSHTLTPMAVYAPEVDKTFFVYAGVTGPEDRYLLIMASYYDHARHRVPRPTIVRDQRGVDDPHDNASIAIDASGHIWVCIAGRGRRRPGQIYRSKAPYCVDAFEKRDSGEQTYSQVWPVPGEGLFHLLTLYTRGRELYWETIDDDGKRSEQNKLAGFGGHYQVSRVHGDKVGTAFNYHPERNVDRRTNLYYMETADFGRTWTTVDGITLETPLDEVENPALVREYESEGRLVYVQKLLMDEAGRPVILYLTSDGFAPGPDNDPRRWELARWDGNQWQFSVITESDHNYDVGSLYLEPQRWTLIAPALTGPQPYFTGGEVGLWVSTDQGATWELERRVTHNSPFNHSYLRRPHNPKDPFYCMWADGDSSQFSICRLFFTNAAGDQLYMLPYTMDDAYAEPIRLDPPVPPAAEDTVQ